MKQVAGLWLPDHEEHLVGYIEGSPRVDGKGTYQLPKLEMALAHVRRFRVALDIGAHCGTWTRILAQRFERVVAFEPMPAHHECFVLNVSAPNVELHRVALAAQAGEIRLTTPAGNSGHTHVADGGEIVTEMRTLDSFELAAVDFVKVDVEGYEREILLGGLETLKRCRPVVIVEQKPNNGRRYSGDDFAALKLLEKLGMRIVAQKAGDYVMTWR